VSDANCTTSRYCENFTCVPDLAQGSPCSRAAMCSTNYCVDGYCCASKCILFCEACAASKTGDLNGVCAPVTPMTDPDDECQDNAVCLDTGICCDPDWFNVAANHPQVPPPIMGPCPK
jgi:hypothetical protein